SCRGAEGSQSYEDDNSLTFRLAQGIPYAINSEAATYESKFVPSGSVRTMAQVDSPQTKSRGAVGEFAATERRDAWWVGPLATGLGLAGFVIYSTARALCNSNYELGVGSHSGILLDHAYLLSPFYSPLIVLPSSLAWISPALLVLW